MEKIPSIEKLACGINAPLCLSKPQSASAPGRPESRDQSSESWGRKKNRKVIYFVAHRQQKALPKGKTCSPETFFELETFF